jgi:hypothetical protein
MNKLLLLVLLYAHLFSRCIVSSQPILKIDKCDSVKKIDFNVFCGKSIGTLLKDKRFKNYTLDKWPYLTEPSFCLWNVTINLGDGVIIKVYPRQPLKYQERCRTDYDWDFEVLKKELIQRVEVKCY